MMIKLTNQQIEIILHEIKARGVSYAPIQEELLDHIACLIEQEMEKGYSFKTAEQLVWTNFHDDALLEIQSETISLLNYKPKRMKKIALSLVAGFALIFTITSLVFLVPMEPSKELAEIPDYVWMNNAGGRPLLVKDIEPPSRAPLAENYKVTSAFGMRLHPIYKQKKMHKGIDFKAAMGTPVYATGDGVVEKIQTHNKYGKLIVIRHDDNYQSLYAQLSKFEVKTGQKIKKGDLIGKTGNSGLSTAPHLHYEVLKDGKAVDPEKYFN
jgi:murein DD-endopeptidase MepM/ murein hydrolase activator NlpD